MLGWFKKIFSNSQTSGYRNPNAWLLDALTNQSSSGVPITPDSAIRLAWIYSGINRISSDIAKLPIHLYKKSDSGREKYTTHPYYYLMKHKPSTNLNAYHLIRQILYNAVLNGNAYCYLERDGNYRVINFIPIQPNLVIPVIEDGLLWYIIKNSNGQIIAKESPINMFHIRGLSSDGIIGLSLWDVARDSIGLGLATERWSNIFFSKGARPSGILTIPQKVSDDDINKIRGQWNSLHQGVDKSQIAIFPPGFGFSSISLPNDVSQLLQTRSFQRRDIAAILSIPPHYLGDETRTSFSSLEVESQSYLGNCLEPWIVQLEYELFDKLLSEKEKHTDAIYFELLREAMLKPSTKERYEIYRVGIHASILSPNECRLKENMPLREGGDTYKDVNAPVKVEPETQDKSDEQTTKELAHLFEKAAYSLVKLELNAVNRAAKSKNFLASIDKFYEKYEVMILDKLQDVAKIIDKDCDPSEAVRAYVEQSRQELLGLSECSQADLVVNLESELNFDSKFIKLKQCFGSF